MRMMSVSLVACVVVLCSGLFVAVEKPAWLPAALGGRDEVLVFLVSSPRRLQDFAAVIEPGRIAAQSTRGLALQNGRVAAVDAAAASDLINALGWVDRRIEILDARRAEPGAPASPTGGARASASAAEASGDWLTGGADTQMSDEARRDRLRELSGQPNLTRGEQLFVMRAMADGIEP